MRAGSQSHLETVFIFDWILVMPQRAGDVRANLKQQ